MKHKKILWIYTHRVSFVSKDIRLMRPYFETEEFVFKIEPKWITLFSFIRQFIFLLLHMHRFSVYVCQFAGYHSFLPSLFSKILNKKLIIITAGYDCASLPAIGYGSFRKSLMRFFTVLSYKLCNHIAPVDESLVYQNYRYDVRFSNQGIKYFMPGLMTPITVIYYGYDKTFWYKSREKEPNTFLTVCGRGTRTAMHRKGIDLIHEVAGHFPQCTFIILGSAEAASLFPPLPNVVIKPFIPHHELIDHYSRAEFYLQLSLFEGFPNALCEAMLCECIPIVSEVSAMPKIVGDSGFILKKRDVDELRNLIAQALRSDKEKLAKLARQRIADNFPEEKRQQGLKQLIGQYV